MTTVNPCFMFSIYDTKMKLSNYIVSWLTNYLIYLYFYGVISIILFRTFNYHPKIEFDVISYV